MKFLNRRLHIDIISLFVAKIGAAILLPTLMFITTLDVLLRDLFNRPIQGANDINCLLLMMFVVFSLSYCWIKRGHIRMELLVRYFSPRWREFSWTMAAFVGVFVFGFMSFRSLKAITYSLKFHEITFEAQIVLWPFRIIFFIGIFIFTVQLLVDFFRHLYKTFTAAEVDQTNDETI